MNGVVNGHRSSGTGMDEDESMMDAADLAALEAAESSFAQAQAQAQTSTGPNGSEAPNGSTKKRMKITCKLHFPPQSFGFKADMVDNRYMEIMNLCVLHLSDVERETSAGVNREELIQWYLEQREAEIENEEDLEHERQLISKVLARLSRVSIYLFEIKCWRLMSYRRIT